MNQKVLTQRIIGFVASLVLTLTAYLIMVNPGFLNLGNKMAVLAIFVLAILQSIVQLICFVSIWRENGPLWNLGVFVSTVSIILIIVIFSIWIMNHLNYNMMP